eukprot:3664463-Pleurochrysis_carterae.AAC.1
MSHFAARAAYWCTLFAYIVPLVCTCELQDVFWRFCERSGRCRISRIHPVGTLDGTELVEESLGEEVCITEAVAATARSQLLRAHARGRDDEALFGRQAGRRGFARRAQAALARAFGARRRRVLTAPRADGAA